MLKQRTACGKASGDQRGFTLQTLIITAALVAVAVVASVVIVAISRSSGERLEDSGGGVESPCQPWEVYKATLAAKGYGGTQGYGGVFSSSIGCIAVCYLTHRDSGNYPTALSVSNRRVVTANNFVRVERTVPARRLVSTLAYDDSNRVPGANEVRLGVAYNRAAPSEVDDFDEFWPDFGYYRAAPSGNTLVGRTRDPDPLIRVRLSSSEAYPGTPIPLEWRGRTSTRGWSRGNAWSASLHVNEPNIWSPASATLFKDWDEDWEFRVDPGREVCEIVDRANVDTYNDDEIKLTSAQEYEPEITLPPDPDYS